MMTTANYNPYYKFKKYLSLKELLSEASGKEDSQDYLDIIIPLIDIRTKFLGWKTPSAEINNILSAGETQELWSLIVANNFDEAIACLEDDETDKKIAYGKFYRLFESTLLRTYPQYSTIIKNFKEQENNLLKQLSAKTTTTANNEGQDTSNNTTTLESSSSNTNKGRINEVPQSTGLDPYDTAYTNKANTGEGTEQGRSENVSIGSSTNKQTSSSTVETLTDPSSIMERLEKIRRLWHNIYREWADEFESLFIPVY